MEGHLRSSYPCRRFHTSVDWVDGEEWHFLSSSTSLIEDPASLPFPLSFSCGVSPPHDPPLSCPTPIGHPASLLFHDPLCHARPRSGIQCLCFFATLSVMPDPDRASSVFAFSFVKTWDDTPVVPYRIMVSARRGGPVCPPFLSFLFLVRRKTLDSRSSRE